MNMNGPQRVTSGIFWLCVAIVLVLLITQCACASVGTSTQTREEEWADMHEDKIIVVRNKDVAAQPGDWLLLPQDAGLEENSCSGRITLFNLYITEKRSDDVSRDDIESAAWIEVDEITYSDSTVTLVTFHFLADENCTGVVSDGLLVTADS